MLACLTYKYACKKKKKKTSRTINIYYTVLFKIKMNNTERERIEKINDNLYILFYNSTYFSVNK